MARADPKDNTTADRGPHLVMLSVREVQRQLGGLDVKRTHARLPSEDELGAGGAGDGALQRAHGVPVTHADACIYSVADVEGHVVLPHVLHRR